MGAPLAMVRRRALPWVLAVTMLSPVAASRAADSPELLLANVWRGHLDPTAYWVSEKLDGARAYWDGRQLRFRSGRRIAAPDWFTGALPARELDGELWAGRGRFERLAGIVRKEIPVDAEWRQVRYMLFELPGADGDFSARIDAMRALVTRVDVPWLGMVEQFRVANQDELRARLDEVVKAGGEGLMLHRADAPYRSGRGDDLLKLKPWEDAEAVVVGHLPGKGRHAGRLGALLVELPDGRRLRLGTGFTDAQRESPPAVGVTVTYRHHGFTNTGLPRFASFLRVREAF